MSRRDIIDNIAKYRRRVDEHREKIRKNPNDRTVSHWEMEIRNFEREIAQLEKDLNVTQSAQAYCPKCKRDVNLNGNKCTICRLAIA